MTTATLNIDETEQALACTPYCKGRAAFLAGEPNKHCPYHSKHGMTDERTQWFTGWFDAKYEEMLYGKQKTVEEAYASFRRGREVFRA